MRGSVDEHRPGTLPSGLLLPIWHGIYRSDYERLPSRHLRLRRHELPGGDGLLALRCGRVPRVRVFLVDGESVHRWILLQRLLDQRGAVPLPAGPLLLRWNGGAVRFALRCWLPLSGRRILHGRVLVHRLRPWLLPRNGKHVAVCE